MVAILSLAELTMSREKSRAQVQKSWATTHLTPGGAGVRVSRACHKACPIHRGKLNTTRNCDVCSRTG